MTDKYRPWCRLCEAYHYLSEPHGEGSEKVRKMGRAVLSGKSVPETVTRGSGGDAVYVRYERGKTVTPDKTVTRGGRGKKVYTSNAERQRAYRERKRNG